MHKGYFLITVTPDTLNQTIEYAAQSGEPHDHCWHLGCILPRVPEIIVRTGMKYITFLDNIWSGDGGLYNYVSTATVACPSSFDAVAEAAVNSPRSGEGLRG